MSQTRAEHIAYCRGYSAGRKRLKKQTTEEQMLARKKAFWQRAAIAAINMAATQDTWMQGNNKIRTIKDRMYLAADFADAMLNEAIKRNRL